MSRSEKVIITNMCMVYDDKGNVLVQNRLNPNWPGITFPGGHVNDKESFSESVIREVYEETGLTIESPKLCGIKQFQTAENERYIVLLYKTKLFKGNLKSSSEGEVFWTSREKLFDYKVANDFEKMLQVFEDDELCELYYYNKDETLHSKLL
ncbi:8-oxo-dGTP diphosphatase [Ornithinibacillus bavariensis]|uniref:7,8-dihydro-8-oxoguanine triphosphatase n=1 Tax=Ornithinibacillus bavariensis TaxID=545502 RepID=A0A919X7T3_9BACI|nr:8-oxo-dGTP diphosphatase [Ornithinibacillus bavariensis]GIO27557.1 7,8-dihydro-8-oxoguanine triphosphatase [Ornithinibacillus bavariensis]